jgi:hypothetical protein
MPFKISEKPSDLKERGHRHKEEPIGYRKRCKDFNNYLLYGSRPEKNRLLNMKE